MGRIESPGAPAPQEVRADLERSPTVGEWRGDEQEAIRSTVGGPLARARLALDAAASCVGILANAGPLAALAYLNSRTRFRFTGVYHARPPYLLNVHLYDRENPTVNVSGDICLLSETYCAIVCDNDHPFRTTDARRDPRLSRHGARDTTLSYCGVPIRRAGDAVWGSLCHFDVRPRLVPPSEAELLELVAPYFAARLDGVRADL